MNKKNRISPTQKSWVKINAKKSFFGREELKYLGYWISRKGIQPISKKVEAIKNFALKRHHRALSVRETSD